MPDMKKKSFILGQMPKKERTFFCLVTFQAQMFGTKNGFPPKMCPQKVTKLCSSRKKHFHILHFTTMLGEIELFKDFLFVVLLT